MSEWSDYENRVAEFFRGLGLDAQVDAPLHGARAEHKIDVAVRFRQFGINILWIVECKLWKTAVPKEKVVALQQIAQDVGADRAFMLAEMGFQAGAIRAARFSNITLTSLPDLSDNAKEVTTTAQLSAVSRAFADTDRRANLWFSDSADVPGPRPGVDFDRVVELAGRLFGLKMYWAKAVAGQFPVVTDIVGGSRIANTPAEFIAQATEILKVVERELAEIEATAEQTRREAHRIGEDLIGLVEALLVSGRAAAVGPHLSDQMWDAALRRAHTDMQLIGDAVDGVNAFLSGQPRRKYFELRSLLIDGIYLHLMERNLAPMVWENTERQVRRMLTEFRTSLDLPLHRIDDSDTPAPPRSETPAPQTSS
jgi:hypothetical protein